MKTYPEKPRPVGVDAEIIAFGLLEDSTEPENAWGFYFGPSWTVPDAEGGVHESASEKSGIPSLMPAEYIGQVQSDRVMHLLLLLSSIRRSE